MKRYMIVTLIGSLAVLVGCGGGSSPSKTYPPSVLTKVIVSLSGGSTAPATPVGNLTLQQYSSPVTLDVFAYDQDNNPNAGCGA